MEMKNIKTPRQKYLVRKRLRKMGILPEIGSQCTKEQQVIINQIKNNDFSYWEKLKKSKYEENRPTETEVEFKGTLKSRRSYVRSKLRKEGYLPPYGQPHNEEQQIIENQIKNNDFTFFNKNIKVYLIDKPHLCKHCGDTDVTNFYIKRKDSCKRCTCNKQRVKYQNGELYNCSNKEWINEENIIHVRVQAAKHRAKAKNIEFELTDEIIQNKLKEQNGRCYFSNVEITFKIYDLHCLSLDRIDSDIGYTVDNTVIVTWFINQAKSSIDSNQFINELKLCYENMMNK
jgi:hypothetical protein